MSKRVAHNKLTQEQVLEQFYEKHGYAYGYDRVVYVDGTTRVEIYCKNHDFYFKMSPKNHKKGCVCPKCEKEKMSKYHSKGKEQFILEAIEIYGDKDSYDLVDYVNNKTQIDVICSVHGKFPVIPAEYLAGRGCKDCRKKKTKSNDKDIFIEEATKVHGDLHDYTNTVIIEARKKIEVRCKKHDHTFKLHISNYIAGQKCPICAMENYSKIRTKTQEQFEKESKEVHGDLDDYSESEYKNSSTEIKIRCKKHDHVFRTMPYNYLNGFRCDKCRMENSKYKGRHHHTREGYIRLAKGRTTHLYLIKCSNEKETFYKIGKTFRSLEKRFSKTNMPYNYEKIIIHSGEAGYIFDLEEKLHKKYKKYKYNVGILFNGYSECYNLNLPIKDIINI